MGPAGFNVFYDLNDMETLADYGVLFLLFEQGLELTVDRLKSLSSYAFGMGTLQVILSTAAFFAFPFFGGVQFLEYVVGSQPEVVDITRVDESLVIGAALSLSSSAFVLKILQEKGQLNTRAGEAALGVLLLQDIAVVPLLVLLPIIESTDGPMPLSAQLILLGETFIKAILGLGGILLLGGQLVRYTFSLIAKTKSSETFVALCLVVALGTGGLTEAMGLSSTLGAFTAGTLLAESNYRTQIETDIKPFRGLLLGLFFLTTGASVDPTVIQEQLPTVLALLSGLIAFKAAIISFLGPRFGLTLAESIKTGFLLSGGGEFAFVVLTLADKLQVLPDQLAKILVGVVVLSMGLTPYLAKVGEFIAKYVDKAEEEDSILDVVQLVQTKAGVTAHGSVSDEVVVICGFGTVGENIARSLSDPALVGQDGNNIAYRAFDLGPEEVTKGFKKGYSVMYGDGSIPSVLATAGIQKIKAFVVTYADIENSLKAVERLHQTFPTIPIFARATDTAHYFELKQAGAAHAIQDDRESSLTLSKSLLINLGMAPGSIDSINKALRKDLENQDDFQLQINNRNSAEVRISDMDYQDDNSNPINAIKNTVDNLSGEAARRLVRFVTNKRVIVDDSGGTVEVDDASGVGILDAVNAPIPASVKKEAERLGVDPSDIGVTVCMLPPRKGSDDSSAN